MTRQFRHFHFFALLGLSAALSPLLGTAQQSQRAATHSSADEARRPIADIPSTVDAPIEANRLIQAFRDTSSLTRVQSLEELDASTALAPETIVATLQEALHDDDPLVRETALSALLRRDNSENPVLSEADLATFQGQNAELAKVHFAEKNSDTSTLKELMRQGDAVVQQSAFEALAGSDLPGAIEALHAELQDTKSLYRLQTLALLARSIYAEASAQLLPILRETQHDRDPLLSHYAKQILKEKLQPSSN